jgi:transposase InsO family protein
MEETNMPWRIEGTMDLKIQMIADWRSGNLNVTELSAKYRISRPTVYKWVERYEEQGIEGLKDQKRIPINSPNQITTEMVELIVQEKLKNRHRGPKKVWHQLKRQYPDIELPAPSTIGEWLKKRGLVEKRKKRLRVPPYTRPFEKCERANSVWSIDYKGQFYTQDSLVCYPLTISDNYSRYLLECQGLPGPRYLETKAVLEKVFKAYGLPDAIRSDNGVPFAGKSIGGLSNLSMWFVQLGIIPERIDKGCPEQNGRHERMHRTLKAETACPASRNMKEQQERFNIFRVDYNNYRPHESLGQDVPSNFYKRSNRPYVEKPVMPDYDFDYSVRHLCHSGEFKFKGNTYYLAQLLAGQPIGLKEIADGQWQIFYSFLPLGILDLRKSKIIS